MSSVFSTVDALHSLSLSNDNRMQLKSFHTGTRTWRKCRWTAAIESDMLVINKEIDLLEASMSEDSLHLPGTSHLPEAVVQQLAMLNRTTAIEKAFPLGDSLLITRSPHNLLIVHNETIRRVKRDATSPQVDFAFVTSTGRILYGGVNMVKCACLQVQVAESIEELETTVSSLEGTTPLFRRYPSPECPQDYKRALFSLHEDILTIVVPMMNKEGQPCLSILKYDVSSGSIDESSRLLSSPLPSSFWKSRPFMWKNQILSLVDHNLITVHVDTGDVNYRLVDSLVSSISISPSGELFLLSSSDVLSSSYLTAPPLSSLARDTVLNRLAYSLRSSIPVGTTDPMLVHTVLS